MMCLKGVSSFVSSALTKNLLNKEIKKRYSEVLSTQCFGGAFKTKCVVTVTITGFSDLKRVD